MEGRAAKDGHCGARDHVVAGDDLQQRGFSCVFFFSFWSLSKAVRGPRASRSIGKEEKEKSGNEGEEKTHRRHSLPPAGSAPRGGGSG